MLPAALNVLDRFHIAKKLGEAVDEVRRQEAKQLAAEGYESVLRFCRRAKRKKLAEKTRGGYIHRSLPCSGCDWCFIDPGSIRAGRVFQFAVLDGSGYGA